jgi:cell filamentation protein
MRDPYVYPGTDILKNKFNIKNAAELEDKEKEYTTARLTQVKAGLVKGNFDIEHFKSIHKHIFGDIYDWAGNFRSIDIVKSELALNGLLFEYSDKSNVHKEIQTALSKLNNTDWKSLGIHDKAHEFSKLLSDVWKAHGFREGNTRTTVTFFSQFARENGFPLNEELLAKNSSYVRNSLVASAFEDKNLFITRNFQYLERIIKDSIKQGIINYSSMREFYSREIPGIKNASEDLLKKLHYLKQNSSDGEYVPYIKIQSLYKELGSKVENGTLEISNSIFKLVSDITKDIRILNAESRSREKGTNRENVLRKDMDQEL